MKAILFASTLLLTLFSSTLPAQTMCYVQTDRHTDPGSTYNLLDSSIVVNAREAGATGNAAGPALPVAVFLPVVPNPADHEVLITWELKRQARVALTVTDEPGRLSITYPMGIQNTGVWTKSVAISALSEGVYFATLSVNNQVFTQRFEVKHL